MFHRHKPRRAPSLLKYPFIIGIFITTFIAHSQDIRIGGFVSNGYIESSHYNYLVDSEGGDADFFEAGINASWTPRERLTVNGQAFAFELGEYGNYELQLDYLFIDYNFQKEFGLRLGRVKREQGIYNHIQDIDAARPSILLPIGIYDQRYRDFSASVDGLSLYGTIDLSEKQTIDYNIFGGHIDLKPEGGLAGFALTTLSRDTVNNHIETIKAQYNFGFQLWFHPQVEGLRLGISSSFMPNMHLSAEGNFPTHLPNPLFAGQPVRSITDNIDLLFSQLAFEYYINDWNFTGEYVHVDNRLNLETIIGGVSVFQAYERSESDSWYLSAARRIGRFESALTYTVYENDIASDQGKGVRDPNTAFNKDLQFSIRYDVTDNWILKLESHNIRGTNRLFNQHEQNPMLDEEQWTLWAAKSTIYF